MPVRAYNTDNHTILHGDVLESLDLIEDESVDLIFADPPYNIGKDFDGVKDKWDSETDYLDWCYKWLNMCLQKLKPNGSFYVMTSTQFMPYFDIFLRNKLTILSRIVWSYDSSGVQAKQFYGSMYEPILFGVKNKSNYTFNAQDILVEAKTGSKRKLIDYRKNPPQVYNSSKVPGNVWDYNRVRYRMDEFEDHPTQKPVALLERIILASSNENDLILDPFSGSFTTCYVSKKLNRRSIGIELQEKYLKIGLRRVEIPSSYCDLELQKEPKTYQIKKNNTLELFDGTPIHK
ncbi:adenine-specific DNA-methyltransferase [Pedobacter cryoconitis]|uniref:Methyltransferase n=1 Tax=Pedobacter cryoconitis TaxID=188932 RepID=A0A327RS67_9SPHI|nr:adenine-specific DNA-methyltransferase [Pedobacter cryoconitis]RAJ19870.1 site-specific DNA-methyltransferase (adenine-specific) [Pedobacter cryoconitis]